MSFNNNAHGSSFNMNNGPWSMNVNNSLNLVGALNKLENNIDVKDIFTPSLSSNFFYNNGSQSFDFQGSSNSFQDKSSFMGNTKFGNNILAGTFSNNQKNNFQNSSQSTQGLHIMPNAQSAYPVTLLATETSIKGKNQTLGSSSLYTNLQASANQAKQEIDKQRTTINTGEQAEEQKNDLSIQAVGLGLSNDRGSYAYLTKTQDSYGHNGLGASLHLQGNNDIVIDYQGVSAAKNQAHNISASQGNTEISLYKDSLNTDNSFKLSVIQNMKNKFMNWFVKISMNKDRNNKNNFGVFASMNMSLENSRSSKRRQNNNLRSNVSDSSSDTLTADEMQSCKMEAISLKTSIISAESYDPEIKNNADWKAFKNSMITSKMKVVASLKKIKDEVASTPFLKQVVRSQGMLFSK